MQRACSSSVGRARARLAASQKHYIIYTDGDQGWVRLEDETWKVVGAPQSRRQAAKRGRGRVTKWGRVTAPRKPAPQRRAAKTSSRGAAAVGASQGEPPAGGGGDGGGFAELLLGAAASAEEIESLEGWGSPSGGGSGGEGGGGGVVNSPAPAGLAGGVA